MGFFLGDIYAPTNVCVKDIGSLASMVLQNYQNFTEMTSNIIYFVPFGVGLKCPRKIHLNTQCPPLLRDNFKVFAGWFLKSIRFCSWNYFFQLNPIVIWNDSKRNVIKCKSFLSFYVPIKNDFFPSFLFFLVFYINFIWPRHFFSSSTDKLSWKWKIICSTIKIVCVII